MSLRSLARALLGRAALPDQRPAEPPRPVTSDATTDQVSSEQEIFGSPRLLARWVNKYFLLSRPLDEDYDLLPNAEARKDLGINVQQRDRCLQEYSVLRIAGVSLFVKAAYSDQFWMAFSQHILVYLKLHVTSTGLQVDEEGLREALEQYTVAGESAEVEQIETLYLTRVYDENPNYIRMKLSGIGGIASGSILDAHDIFRNAYYGVTRGCSYEVYKNLSEAMEQEKREA